jgi:hypothetical protein
MRGDIRINGGLPGCPLQPHIFVLSDLCPLARFKKFQLSKCCYLWPHLLRREKPHFDPNYYRILGNYYLTAGKTRQFGLNSGPEKHSPDRWLSGRSRKPRPQEVRSPAEKYARNRPGFPFPDPTLPGKTPYRAPIGFAWKIALNQAPFAEIRPHSMSDNGP